MSRGPSLTWRARLRSNPSTSLKRFSTALWIGHFGLKDSRARAPFDCAQGRSAPHTDASLTRGCCLGFHQQPAGVCNQVSNFKGFHQEWNVVLLEETADFRFGKTGESEQQMF